MKKFICLLLWVVLIAVSPAYADMNGYVAASGGAAVAGCDTCSGNLVATAHFEGTGDIGTPFDITTGTPCGCNTNADKTFEYSSDGVNSQTWASDGTWSFKRAGASDKTVLTIDALSSQAVSIQFDLYVTTWANACGVSFVTDGVNDEFGVSLGTTDELQLYWNGNGTSLANTTSGWNLATNTKYTIRIQGRGGATDPSLRATKDGGSTFSDNTNTTNWTDNPSTFQFGTGGTCTGVYYIDNIKVWNNWQTGADWGD